MAAKITPIPDAPNKQDSPQQFSTKADAYVGALPGFVTDANALADEVENNTTAAAASASAAAISATNAANSAASSAASANFLGAWSGLTGAATVPSSVAHVNKMWILLNNVADITAHEPGVSANWQEIQILQSFATNRALVFSLLS